MNRMGDFAAPWTQDGSHDGTMVSIRKTWTHGPATRWGPSVPEVLVCPNAACHTAENVRRKELKKLGEQGAQRRGGRTSAQCDCVTYYARVSHMSAYSHPYSFRYH